MMVIRINASMALCVAIGYYLGKYGRTHVEVKVDPS